MNRRRLAVVGLIVLVALSGCSLFDSGGEISEDELTKEVSYDWETNATASFNLSTSKLLSLSADSYKAVIRAENETLDIHRERTFRGDTSVSIEALKYRFENGTVVNATHSNLTAVEHSERTELQLPATNGTVAYTASWGGSSWGGYGRSWSTPTFVDGSHEVTLPEGARVGIPLLSRVRPGSQEKTVENDRMTIRWDDPDNSEVAVRYYQLRDLYLLGTLVLIAIIVGIAGTIYYYRQIQRAKRKRKDVGLDVEQDDDDVSRDGPPPGMQ
jgi:hypothetical protein